MDPEETRDLERTGAACAIKVRLRESLRSFVVAVFDFAGLVVADSVLGAAPEFPLFLVAKDCRDGEPTAVVTEGFLMVTFLPTFFVFFVSSFVRGAERYGCSWADNLPDFAPFFSAAIFEEDTDSFFWTTNFFLPLFKLAATFFSVSLSSTMTDLDGKFQEVVNKTEFDAFGPFCNS